MANELLALLLRATCWISLAIVVVLAVRWPLRRLFGCGVAYAAWLAVPLCALAVLIPAPATPVMALPFSAATQPLAQVVRIATAPASALWPWAVLGLWLAGAAVAAGLQVRRQRSFMRNLGPLERHGDLAQARSRAAGPALVGLRHPFIVVPGDFEQRYTPSERILILAHERAHARRRDPLANLGCAIMQCVWWFNPLVHLAAHLARLDQELACDADVVRRHPDSLRDYAGAMLKTQLAAASVPLACQWQPNHPVKERIMNLNRQASRAMRITGSTILAVALGGASYAAWAVQAAQAPAASTYDMALEMDMGGDHAKVKLRMAAGEPAAVELGDGARRVRASFIVTPAKDKGLYVKTTLARDGKPLGEPALLVKPGEQAGVKIGLPNNESLDIRLKVTPAVSPAPK
ncbi:MAG: M56 family metallopeptidase [Pseudomonadota bacterium]